MQQAGGEAFSIRRETAVEPQLTLSVILACQMRRLGQFLPVFMPSYVMRITKAEHRRVE